MLEKTWLNVTQEQIINLGINMNMEAIKDLSKYQWKIIITEAVENKESMERESWMKTSTKCIQLEINRKHKSMYLNKLNPAAATTILKLRLNMTNLRTNYKNAHKNLQCPVCQSQNLDTLKHLFNCPNLPEIPNFRLPNNFETIIYKNSENDTVQNLEFFENMAQAIQKLMKQREKVLSESENQRQSAENRDKVISESEEQREKELKEREEQASTRLVPSEKRIATA